MKCSYTVHPSWFGGQAQARKAVAELASHTAHQIYLRGCGRRLGGFVWSEIKSIVEVAEDEWIATIEYGS